MSRVEDGVNIEHLLVEAMHNMSVPLPEDPLPSAEEIAGAKAAVAAAHSTCSAAALPSQPVKGLGGVGLSMKRKGGSKAGNSSTISAATAPPALLGSRPAAGRAAPGGGSNLGAGADNSGSRVAAAPRTGAQPPGAPSAPAASAGMAATEGQAAGDTRTDASLSGVPTPDGSRSLSKDAAGVRSFRTVLSPDTDGSSDWETASNEGSKASPSAAGKDVSSGSVRTAGSSSWGGSISSMLEEFAEPSTLALCGVVLGACASALLVLGASAWLKSRQ